MTGKEPGSAALQAMASRHKATTEAALCRLCYPSPAITVELPTSPRQTLLTAHKNCIVLPTTLLPNRLEAAPVLYMPTKKPYYTACAYVPPQMQHTLLQPAHQPIEPFAAPPQPWAPVFCRLRAK